jgi:hypothetical protein
MDYNNIHGSLLFITLGLFLFGLVFGGKLKYTRHIIWTFSVISLIGYIVMFFHHEKSLNAAEKKVVGLYRLDTANSIYKSIKLKDYFDIVLTLKSDNRFILNREVPFFYSTEGSWTYFNNGDMSGIKGEFDNSGNEFEVYDNLGSLTFSSWNLKNAVNGDEIAFVRQ